MSDFEEGGVSEWRERGSSERVLGYFSFCRDARNAATMIGGSVSEYHVMESLESAKRWTRDGQDGERRSTFITEGLTAKVEFLRWLLVTSYCRSDKWQQ